MHEVVVRAVRKAVERVALTAGMREGLLRRGGGEVTHLLTSDI